MITQAQRYLNNAKLLRRRADECEDCHTAKRFIEDAKRYEQLAMDEIEADLKAE